MTKSCTVRSSPFFEAYSNFLHGSTIDIVAPLLTWDISPNSLSTAVMDGLAQICLGPWCNTLAELRFLTDQGRNVIAEHAMRRWESFGAFMGLTEAVAHARLQRLQDDLIDDMKSGHRTSKTRGCCWHGCACTDILARHPLRACKGCHTYAYCSKKCQKK